MRRIALAIILAVTSFPAIAAPCAGFTDVDTSSSFCTSIAWMRNRGITLGCTATQYCPNDPVTRLQMAAFMYRLGFQNAFLKDGNAFGGTAVLGTTDDEALELRVNNARVMRYEPDTDSPNVIGGHTANSASPFVYGATIAGGGSQSFPNGVADRHGTIGGGVDNRAEGRSSTVGGGNGNRATGWYTVVPGGFGNTASGHSSFAAGVFARANADYCGVFSLWPSGGPGMQCFGVPSQFNIGAAHGMSIDYFSQRADGGGNRFVYIGDRFPPFTIVTWTNATLGDNGVWNSVSDVNRKHAFAEVDKRALLERLAALPIRSWSYRVESDDVRHIGPTSQDFQAMFGLGSDDKTIGMIDADGVALAAIQGLNAKLEAALAERDARIEALTNELARERDARTSQSREIAELRSAMAILLARMPPGKDTDRIAVRAP